MNSGCCVIFREFSDVGSLETAHPARKSLFHRFLRRAPLQWFSLETWRLGNPFLFPGEPNGIL